MLCCAVLAAGGRCGDLIHAAPGSCAEIMHSLGLPEIKANRLLAALGVAPLAGEVCMHE